MKKGLFVLFILTELVAYSQDLTSLISDKNIHSILKESQTELTIINHKDYDLKRHYKLIIKNKFGDYLKNINIFQDNFRKIKKANVIIRDLSGNEIDKYKLNDFEDKVYDFSNFDSDDSFKVLKPSTTKYPFEIEVSYSIHNTASLFYTVWQPEFENMHVINAQLKVIDFTKNNLRYISKNAKEPEIIDQENSKVYKWTLSNSTPGDYESYNSISEDYFSTVLLAPNQFEMDGYKGDLSSWKSFGNWVSKLNDSRNTFSDDDRKAILSSDLKKESTLETVKSIYRYLQQTTRYISVQIGIGGYQPFKSGEVHEKKFGDCKGLSFYTQSLLELFEIKSYYTLVSAGESVKELNENFSDGRFNHAILTVPIENDTIFLECTSQTNPFGYAGKFTGNRKALLISGEKSKIINTIKYDVADNRQITKVNIVLDLNQTSALVRMNKKFKGTEIEYENFLYQYQNSKAKNINWIQDTYDWGGAIKIDSLSLIKLKGNSIPEGGFRVVFSNKKEFIKRGNRVFLSPNKYLTRIPSIPKETNRRTPIRIRFGFQVQDSISYHLGSVNYFIENNQSEVFSDSKFGTYKRKVEIIEGVIKLKRSFQLNDGNYPPEDFEGFRSFLLKVRKSDLRKIILKKEI